MLRKGKPFSLIDQALQTEWTIHPFAWQLKEGARTIQFDWEHTEYRFVKPADLSQYDHVSQLEVGLQRVTVSPELERGLAVLRNDHESGAQALAIKALQILKEAVRWKELNQYDSREDWWREFRMIAWHLSINGRPSMAAAIETGILRALNDISEDVSASNTSLEFMKQNSEQAIEHQITFRKFSLDSLAKHFIDYVEAKSSSNIKIVTLSSSGTIKTCLAAFIEAHVRAHPEGEIKLTVLESRPKFEGAAFVNNLLQALPNVTKNLKVKIVSDASVATVVTDADFVVLGGDRVNSKGDVSNKIGSYTLCLVAKKINPESHIIALFETDKISSGGSKLVEWNDERELTDSWPAGVVDGLKQGRGKGYKVEITNAYFEWVPVEYIDQHISQEGFLGRGDIEKLAWETERQEKRVFKDL